MQWPLQDAKNKFSELVNAALAGEPQEVTREGKPVVIVVAIDEYERLCQVEKAATPNFVEHLLAIPKGGPDDLFEHIPQKSRDVDL